MSQEKFDPSVPKYKKIEDLPHDQKQNFKDVEGGFVKVDTEDDVGKAMAESEGIMLGKTISVKYQYGEYGGYGEMDIHPSLVLNLNLDGEDRKIRIDRDMKLALGIKNLTEKRREAIKETMPGWIQVEDAKNIYKHQYPPTDPLKLGEGDILRWAEMVKEKVEIIPSDKRPKSKSVPWGDVKERVVRKQQGKFLDLVQEISKVKKDIGELENELKRARISDPRQSISFRNSSKFLDSIRLELKRPDPTEHDTALMDNYYRVSTYSLVDFAERRLEEYLRIKEEFELLASKYIR